MAVKIDAKPMIMSMTKNSKDKAVHLENFFKAANTNGLQGPAIISYFTEVNRVNKNRKQFTEEALDRFDKLPDLIDSEVNKNPELAKETRTFIHSLKQMYPKTLDKRISLASQGAVTSDRVEPKSRLKRFMVFLNQLLKEE